MQTKGEHLIKVTIELNTSHPDLAYHYLINAATEASADIQRALGGGLWPDPKAITRIGSEDGALESMYTIDYQPDVELD